MRLCHKLPNSVSLCDTFNFDLKLFIMVDWMDRRIGTISSSVVQTRETHPAKDKSFILANNINLGPSNLESNDYPSNDKNKVSLVDIK